jgi:hypothetical protein
VVARSAHRATVGGGKVVDRAHGVDLVRFIGQLY